MIVERRIRWYQRALHEYLTTTPEARAIEIAHRRWGKDEVALQATSQLAQQRPASYWHCLPEYEQGRKAIWTAVNARTGRLRIDEAFPLEMRKRTDNQRMFIELLNGSSWQVIGSDRFDATVGAGPAGIVYSEWALSNPSAWAYHRPMLLENEGWAAFITTPRGRNHAMKMFQYAQTSPHWFAEMSTVLQTKALTTEQLAEALAEYQTIYGNDFGKAQFQQEYYCDFNAAILGAFYGSEMAAVRAEGRIVEVEPPPGQEVHCAWDIGVRDDTSIIWFVVVGTQIFIIDSYSAPGGDVKRFAEICHEKPWPRGFDFVPHDAEVREWGTGRSRIESMLIEGLNPFRVPNMSKLDGINAARRTLPRCIFHPRNEDTLISALEEYCREWDKDRHMFLPNERRDWTTHLCLSGDSLVDTPDGPVPLRNIKVGMSVLTPSGQAKVLAAGPVKRVNEMMRIETADGRVLECTPDHPIFTERGLLSADALRYSDVVLSEGSDLWRSALSRSREDGIGFRDAITLTPARDGSTDISGSRLMAPSLIGTIFTTSMEMARTTLSKISNASIVANTAGITCTNAMSEASYSHQAPMHSLPPQSGIAPKKAGAGTKNTEGRLGGTANGIWLHVRNVVESFAHHIRRGPNTVTRIARHRLCGEEEDGLLVYDLTVEKHHCFWANGILVGNCDAFRYLSLAWRNIPIDEPKGIDPQWLQDWQKVIPPRPGQVPLPAPPRDGNGTRIKL